MVLILERFSEKYVCVYIYISLYIYGCHFYVIVISFLLFNFYHLMVPINLLTHSPFLSDSTILCPKSKPQRTPTPKAKRTASASTQLKSYTFRWSYTLTKTLPTTIHFQNNMYAIGPQKSTNTITKVILSSIFHTIFTTQN